VTFSSIDRRRIRQREREAKAIEADNETIMSTIMEHYDGRRWLYDKFVRGHIFSTPFSSDPIQMAYNCGIQNEALRDFQQVVALCPDEYLQMMKEANERDKLERDASRRQSGPDAARERGNADEAERIGIVSERRDEAGDGDDED
jgi:hypothetical protein